MRSGALIVVLASAGHASANRSLSLAFVQPGCNAHWLSSPKSEHDNSSRQRRPRDRGGLRTDGRTLMRKAHNLALDIAGSMIAHPAKAARGGEDAFFVLENDMGVFDGVGAWAAKGHDPGIFTRGFAEAVAANISAQRSEKAVSHQAVCVGGIRVQRPIADGIDLQQALEHGASKAPGQGTCTACVVTFDPVYGMLTGANVGDSGALLIRRDARGTPFVALRSAAQRHGFNQPYQLGTGSQDRAANAQSFLFYVREGDVVILATDGLLDNMYESDIVQCISETQHRTPPKSPGSPEAVLLPAAELAGALTRRAFDLSCDKERVSPWEDEAVAAGVVPARRTGSLPEVRQSGWSWDTSQWGPALERSLFPGPHGVRSGGRKGVDGMDPRKAGSEEISDAHVGTFRGGKTDDITVVVASVRRAPRKRKRPAETGPNSASGGLASADEAGAHAGLDAR